MVTMVMKVKPLEPTISERLKEKIQREGIPIYPE